MGRMPFSEHVLHDEYFSFDEAAHQYMYDDTPLTSTTTLVKSFASPFDSDRMSKRIADRDNKTQQQVLDEWDAKKEIACRIGTNVHLFAERLSYGMHWQNCLYVTAGEMLDAAEDERGYMHAVVKFFMDHPEIMHGYSLPEARIYNIAEGIAGTVDLMCNYKGVPTILDWKTSREIDVRGYGMMLPPVAHLHDCNLTHYQLQMSAYSRMLKQPRYGFHADRFVVVHLKPTGFYNVYDLPPLDVEIESMINARRKESTLCP